MITIPALAPYKLRPLRDPGYEERAIRMDAARAAKLGDDPVKSCSYPSTSWQRALWMAVYGESRGG